jgi:hypothetical protein
VYTWPEHEGNNEKPDSITWISRLRSGYNATDRKSARWTIESSFHYTDKTHERLLSTSPECYFRKGKPFSDPSLDVLLIDIGNSQDYEKFLLKIASKCCSQSEAENVSSAAGKSGQETRILDRAWYLARHMFREQA